MFYEPLEDSWRQGDVVLNIEFDKKKSDLAILVTPQCDILHDKADFLLFILAANFKDSLKRIIDPDNSLTEDHLNGLTELSKTKLKSIISNLLSNLNGAGANRFYYLPPCRDYGVNFEPIYLDFQKILSVPKDIFHDWKVKRVTTIANPFRSQIFTRYLSYIGRIGTPDYREEDIQIILSSAGLNFRREDFIEICQKKIY